MTNSQCNVLKMDEMCDFHALEVEASFLMIGQSNMAGRGDLSEVDSIYNEHCRMLRNARWLVMSEPINPDGQILDPARRSGINLAASFADDVQKNFACTAGLIPCAAGGTKLCQWMPGELLFDHAVALTRLAQRSSKLRGILWHQGCSDAVAFMHDKQYADEYVHNLAIMFSSLRAALNERKVPVIIGEIPELLNHPRITSEIAHAFNHRLAEMAERIGNCAWVKAADLPVQADGIHFSAQSLRILGHRYFEAFTKFRFPDFRRVCNYS